jgi:hypothetical protein
MELKDALKSRSHLQRMTCLRITGGMRSTPTSALEDMLMLPPLHLFIKHEGSKVLIKMTDEMPLLLAQMDKFVTLNTFDRKFSFDFPTREDWSTECVALVALDGLVFFTDGSLCEGRAGSGVFSDILNIRKGVICLGLSCYGLLIRSICYCGDHCQQSSINLL